MEKCRFILKNGKQCGNKSGVDELAQGFCFRHRTTPQPTKPTHQPTFCTFVLPSNVQCKNVLPSNVQCKNKPDRCWSHGRYNMYLNKLDDMLDHLKKFKFVAPPPPQPQQYDEIGFFDKLDITTKESWKAWIVKNHPDKGGDNELFIRVLKAGRNKFP
jgi:hypothetical protein